MKNQDGQSEIKTNAITQVKKEYQMPRFNEYGSLMDLTAGPGVGDVDGNFTGSPQV